MWHDEISTYRFLAASNESFPHMTYDGVHSFNLLKDGIFTVESANEYFEIPPESGYMRIVKFLIEDEPQRTPVYWILLRAWTKYFGSSVSALRSMSAVFSVLLLPFIYLLCRELFESEKVGLIATAIVSVSPVHVLYAQDAREYSLWVLVTVISSLALLRALRINSICNWFLYSIAVIVGCYSHLLFVFVAAAQGVFVLLLERFKFSKNFKSYLISTVVSVLAFIPWIYFIFTNKIPVHAAGWTAIKVSYKSLLVTWGGILSRIFFDANLTHKSPVVFTVPVGAIVAFLVACSCYYFIRNARRKERLFILSLLFITAAPLVIPDLIFGGRRSQSLRYLMPSILCIEFFVAYFLSETLESSKRISKAVSKILIISVVCGGIFSCLISAQANTWWNKYTSKDNPLIAKKINKAQNPLVLVINEGRTCEMLSLVYLLDPKTSVFWNPTIDDFEDYNKFETIYLVDLNKRSYQSEDYIKEKEQNKEMILNHMRENNYNIERLLSGHLERKKIWKASRKRK